MSTTEPVGPIKVLAHRVTENGRSDRVAFASESGTVCVYLTYHQWRQVQHAETLLVAVIGKDW